MTDDQDIPQIIAVKFERWGIAETVGFFLTQTRTPMFQALISNVAQRRDWTKQDTVNFGRMVKAAEEYIRLLAVSGEIEVWGRKPSDPHGFPKQIEIGVFFYGNETLVLRGERPKDGHSRGRILIDGTLRFEDIYITVDDAPRKKIRRAGNKLSKCYPKTVSRLKRIYSGETAAAQEKAANTWVEMQGEISQNELVRRWSDIPTPKPFTRDLAIGFHRDLSAAKAIRRGGRPRKNA